MTGDALAALPIGGGDLAALPPLHRATAGFLWQYRESIHTRAAYQRIIRDFLAWCEANQLDPLVDGTRETATRYAAWLAEVARPRTGQPLARASVSHHLSVLSQWYEYLTDDALIRDNPFRKVRRPRIDKYYSPTRSLTEDEVQALLRAATGDEVLGGAGYALLLFIAITGARVSEACDLDVTQLGWQAGVRTAHLAMKGGKSRVRPLPPVLAAAVDALVAGRTAGPVFTDRAGVPIVRQRVYKLTRRAARTAGIAGWEKVSPHVLRHAWATIAKERGASVEDRQYALGHSDPRTTQRYDHALQALQNDPAYRVAGAIAPAKEPSEGNPK